MNLSKQSLKKEMVEKNIVKPLKKWKWFTLEAGKRRADIAKTMVRDMEEKLERTWKKNVTDMMQEFKCSREAKNI